MNGINKKQLNELLADNGLSKVIIFDMGDVLVKLNKWKLGFSKVPLGRIVWYMLTHLRTPRAVQKLVLDLYALSSEQQAAPWAQQLLDSYRMLRLAPIDDGRAVPDLVAAWQRGDFSNDILRIKIKERSSHNFARGVYKSREEQTIIYELAVASADARAVAQYTELLPTGIELLQKSAHAGHMIMIVSNWDMASFDLLREKFAQELFKFVKPEHILVSAQLCMLKPCPEIYMTALERARNALDKPFIAYFVDNSLANVRMAEHCGMKGIQHTFS